jgi:hypothetical protein
MPIMAKHIHRILISVASIFLATPFCLSTEVDGHLRFLSPLIGVEWIGGYVGDDAAGPTIELKFVPILDGAVVEYTREAPEADYSSVTHIYWDPHIGKVRFLSLDNRGIVGEGIVVFDGDEIRFQGEDHRRSGVMEFRTVLSVNESETLRDLFWRKTANGWVRGHHQEFRGPTRSEEQGVRGRGRKSVHRGAS